MPVPAPAAPSSWALAYVGLPYVMGVGECAHRAALVWRQRFGLDIEVGAAFGDREAAQRLIEAELARPDWRPVPTPREGDAVVMTKAQRLAHIGLWVAPAHVLHCTRAEGMTLTPVEDLPAQGFAVHGYYRRREEGARAA